MSGDKYFLARKFVKIQTIPQIVPEMAPLSPLIRRCRQSRSHAPAAPGSASPHAPLTLPPPTAQIPPTPEAAMSDFITELTDRLMRYAAIDSQSDDEAAGAEHNLQRLVTGVQKRRVRPVGDH